MLSETIRQAAVRLSTSKRDVGWLFDVVDKNSNEYHWSTKAYTVATPTIGQTYAFKIVDFDGYEVSTDNATSGIITPNEVQFTILNKNGALYSTDFIGGTVTISLRCSDTVGQETLRGCKFRIKKTVPLYGNRFRVVAEDFLQKYLKGSYPNTPYPDDLFLNSSVDQEDGICIPITFGTAYIPVKPVYVENGLPVTGITISFVASSSSSDAYIKDSARGFTYMSKRRFVTITGSSVATNNGMFEVLSSSPGTLAIDYDSGIETQAAGDNITASQSQQFYILGSSTATFTPTTLMSPRELGRISTWPAATYDHVQTVITDRYGDDWKGLQVRETDGSEVLFKQGDMFIAAPLKFSRQYTASMTAFQDVIDFVLKDFGIDTSEINSTTFTTAGATRASLSWGGGIYYKEPRETVLAKLLNQCHCGIIPGASGIELRAISAASVATITSADIINPSGDVGEGSFVFEDTQMEQVSDCGHVAWQPTDESTDRLMKLLVSAKGSLRSQIDSEVLEMPFVHDSKCVQRLGTLYYQRKLMKSGRISFLGKSQLLNLDPNDVITIAANVNYTSSSTTNLIAVIDSVKYNKDLSVQISGNTYSCVLDSWVSLTPTAITVPTDVAEINCFQPLISGPVSNEDIGRSAYDMWGQEWLKVGPTKNQGEFIDIQKALNMVKQAGGGAIYILDGNYQASSPLYIPNVNLEIIGQSQGGVILKNLAGSDLFVLHNLTKTYKFSNFSITSQNIAVFSKMLHIYGDADADNSASLDVKNIIFTLTDDGAWESVGDTGIYVDKGANGRYVFKENKSTDGKQLIWATISTSCFVDVNLNVIKHPKSTGIIAYAGNVNLSANKITDIGAYGIYFNASVCTASDNVIECITTGSGNSLGIVSFGSVASNSLTIKGNRIKCIHDGITQTFIGIYLASPGSVTENDIYCHLSSSGNSIGVLDMGNKAAISNNTIYIDNDASTINIGLSVSGDDNALSSNTINLVNGNARDVGISLGETSQRNKGSGNAFSNCGTNISDNGTENTVNG